MRKYVDYTLRSQVKFDSAVATGSRTLLQVGEPAQRSGLATQAKPLRVH